MGLRPRAGAIVERQLIDRYPHTRKLIRALGWIERGLMIGYLSYRLTHNQIGQWQDNQRTLAALRQQPFRRLTQGPPPRTIAQPCSRAAGNMPILRRHVPGLDPSAVGDPGRDRRRRVRVAGQCPLAGGAGRSSPR
jgi:hypothetical protein